MAVSELRISIEPLDKSRYEECLSLVHDQLTTDELDQLHTWFFNPDSEGWMAIIQDGISGFMLYNESAPASILTVEIPGHLPEKMMGLFLDVHCRHYQLSFDQVVFHWTSRQHRLVSYLQSLF